MVRGLVKPGAVIIAEMTAEDAHLLHMVVGVVGEIGEMMECVLARTHDPENFLEEGGDMEFYIEGVRQAVGLDLGKSPADAVLWVTAFTAIHSVCLNDLHWAVPGSPLWISLVLNHMHIDGGKLLDAVKKRVIYRKELSMDAVKQSLMRVHVWLEILYKRFNTDSAAAKAHNIGKLGKRYEGLRYSNQAAQDRADKTQAEGCSGADGVSCPGAVGINEDAVTESVPGSTQ